jgi:hypothetical protein
MRKALLLVSILAAMLGVVCIQLSRQLTAMRTHADALAASSNSAVDTARHIRPSGPEVSEPQAPVCAPSRIEHPERPAQQSIAREETDARGPLRRSLARLSDPASRKRAIDRATFNIRYENPDVANALGLTAADEEALIALLAADRAKSNELGLRMEIEGLPYDARQQEYETLRAESEQRQLMLLGDARYQQYLTYRTSVPERQELRQLRVRLDEADAMTSAQADQLMSSLRMEREAYVRQHESLQVPYSYQPQYPFTAMPVPSDPSAMRLADEAIQRTEAFMNRLHARAAGVLSTEQLKRFDEMQAEQLSEELLRLERLKERLKARQ